jgi:GTP-binding protein
LASSDIARRQGETPSRPDRRAIQPAVSGRRAKIRYITQPKARPPFFIPFGNAVASTPESCKRYLVNGLRETFGLIGVPIRLSLCSGGDNAYAGKKKGKS